MFNSSKIKLVEELTQTQLDKLKECIYWGTYLGADFGNLREQERRQVREALFESDISNKIIYKLFSNIYFTDADFNINPLEMEL